MGTCEVEQSAYNFERADVPALLRHFDDHEKACKDLRRRGLAHQRDCPPRSFPRVSAETSFPTIPRSLLRVSAETSFATVPQELPARRFGFADRVPIPCNRLP